MTDCNVPLDILTQEIIACYEKGNDLLISAAQRMLQAKQRVDAGEAGPDWDWLRWRAVHMMPHMSKQWINVQLEIAGSPDPEKAAAERRAKNAADERKRRQQHAAENHVASAPLPTPDELPTKKPPFAPRLTPPDTSPNTIEEEPDIDFSPSSEFPDEAEAIEKEGASKRLIRAVDCGFVTYSHAKKLITKTPETQDRMIHKAENEWLKGGYEKLEAQHRTRIEAAVKLLADRLAEKDFRRFTDLLRRAGFFSEDTVFCDALHIEAQKRGIVVDGGEGEGEWQPNE